MSSLPPPSTPPATPAASSSAAVFHERLTPAWWLWLIAVGMGIGFGLTVARVSGAGALIAFVVSTAVIVVLLVRSTPTISVDATSLTAGRARIPLAMLGDVEVLDVPQMRHAHGPGLDARAYLCLRGWIHTGVRARLVDPQDPTPYWLLSSRHPEELAAAIAAAGVADR